MSIVSETCEMVDVLVIGAWIRHQCADRSYYRF